MPLLSDDCPGHARVTAFADVPHARRAVTIGNYDGIHRGHQAVLAQLTQTARADNLESALLSFEPSPLEFFQGNTQPSRISALADKAALLEELCPDLDRLVVLPFDDSVAQMPALDFIQNILCERLGAAYLTVGEDFRFGHDRHGDIAMLHAQAPVHDYRFEPAPTFEQDDARVSSSRIREALSAGDLDRAAQWLGHPYVIQAPVVEGDRRGREIGFPTANLDFPHNPPVRGVFAVRAHCDGRDYPAVANVGHRPTVDGTRLLIEVHLLDFAGNLYGSRLGVQFCRHLRGEQRFESIQQLREQITRDVAAAQQYFAHG